MKKMIILGSLLAGIIGFSARGLNLPFTNDGKLYEDELLNKWIVAEDTELRITKTGKDAYNIEYYFSEDGTSEIEKAYRNRNMICSQEGGCIGYDTKLKKVVFLDEEDNRIIYSGYVEED